ncbi:cytochrome ubiquinol oxidase subunit I [Castellaniella sp. UC4442_H9]|jgi:cytochrome d ubiquinol oxidase subunit I|nr:cytochrome ubiquinol oxidase subunit I [Castellaniella sp.]
MTQTAWVLSLTQFYLSLGFVLFFLALELGLTWVLFGLRLRAHGSTAALLAYRFWVRVFALTLMLGFGASLPLVLQFGTLWPRIMDRAGEVVGPLVAMTVLTAFVFKSCFLGAMLYGQRSLSDWAHTLVVTMVAIGTSLTAYWIVTLLAWMQWPVGTALSENHYQIADWLALVGGAAPVLFGVLLTGGMVLAATLMLAVTAGRTDTRPSDEGDRSVYAIGLWLLVAALLLQVALAVQLGRELLPVQPARLAAVIPQWHSGPPDRLTLLAWLDVDALRNVWALYGPQASDWLPPVMPGPLKGLNDLAPLGPPVWLTYASARLAALLAMLLVAAALWSLWQGSRQRYEPDVLTAGGRLRLRIMMWAAVALQAVGWGHVLVGSLPYAVYGAITLREVGTSQNQETLWGGLVLHVIVYTVLALGFLQLLRHTTRFGVVPVARYRGRA